MIAKIIISSIFASKNKVNMEEFGDWIYILFIVIAAIASLISSVRKKSQQAAEQNQPREITTTQSNEDDFWDDLSTKRQEEKPVFTGIPIRTVAAPEKHKKPYTTSYQDRLQSLQSEKPETVEIMEEYGMITLDDLPDNTDEWRKAFIYNEIFNHKK